MKNLAIVAVAAAGAGYLADYVTPHVVKAAKLKNGDAILAVQRGTVAVLAAGLFWAAKTAIK